MTQAAGSGQAKSGNHDITEVAAVSLTSKIPTFWSDQPRLWFVQFEAVVANQKMSDENKYNLLVTKLVKDNVEQASDVLLAPPETKRYELLKNRLMTVYEESENKQFQRLLSEMELGDQKPSKLLRKMKDLARKKLPDETLRMMWTGHLPASVRAVLAVTEIQELEKLAELADKIMETTRPIEVAEVASQKPKPQERDLAAELEELRLEVIQLRGRQPWRRPGRDRFRPRSSSGSRQGTAPRRRSSNDPDWLCNYHFRYGHRANSCLEPCAWKKTQGTSGN